MAGANPKDILKQAKKGEFSNIYYIYGADIVAVQKLTSELIRCATDGNAEMALTSLDGTKPDLAQLDDAVQQFSMFSAYNCVRVHDLNGDSMTDTQLKRLLEILSHVGAATVLIIDITGFDVKGGKKSPTTKNNKIIQAITKANGVVCEAALKSDYEMAKDCVAVAEKMGCTMDIQAAKELVQMCLKNTMILQNEMEKLVAYAQGKMITLDMVHEVTAALPETTTFNLARAVVNQQPVKAMQELDRLYAMRTERTSIISSISGSFLDMYRAATAIRSARQKGDMKSDFGYRYDFMIDNAFQNSRRISPAQLRSCICILRDLELELNSTSSDERILLEAAIVKMLSVMAG